MAKQNWEKRFDEMWFAPKGETTIMNWEGLIKGNEGFFDLLFGNYRSADTTEAHLKENLAWLIKEFIKREFKVK